MSDLGLFDLFSSQKDLENKLRHLLVSANFSPPDCVEDGSNKLAKLMAENFTYIGPVKSLDIRRTFGWLQNKQLRDDFVIARSPLRQDHFSYWRSLLNDPTQCVFTIRFSGKHVGNCGLKNIDAKNRSCEMWVYLADLSARGQGVASIAVQSLLEKAKSDFQCENIYLHVSKTNFPAIKLYRGKGFIERTKRLDGRWMGQDANIAFMERTL
jgi:RimJ/RimL family protein N-acetyltransferase